ncbi:hypothetical protein EFBL_0608 [Effusibacillus lacus]|uniref:Pre-toxin TG domain-containing protein n=2 Tax=Effusibacillus lacus TaxID=1348429 RepID=A0A292YKT9_9BACL|nr:hypothetical protein EFBL_0608 [Effusibacillus lacus]
MAKIRSLSKQSRHHREDRIAADARIKQDKRSKQESTRTNDRHNDRNANSVRNARDHVTISKAAKDKQVESLNKQVEKLKIDYMKAEARGDRAGMDRAHQQANELRKMGATLRADEDTAKTREYKRSHSNDRDRVTISKPSVDELNRGIYQAKYDYAVAQARGDKKGMELASRTADNLRARGGTISAGTTLEEARRIISSEIKTRQTWGSKADTTTPSITNIGEFKNYVMSLSQGGLKRQDLQFASMQMGMGGGSSDSGTGIEESSPGWGNLRQIEQQQQQQLSEPIYIDGVTVIDPNPPTGNQPPNPEARRAASTITDFVPGIGNVKSGVEAVTGKDPVTGEELSPAQRTISAIGIVGGGSWKESSKTTVQERR